MPLWHVGIATKSRDTGGDRGSEDNGGVAGEEEGLAGRWW